MFVIVSLFIRDENKFVNSCDRSCSFSSSNCAQQFHNRTSLRRHQLKYHSNISNDSQNAPLVMK